MSVRIAVLLLMHASCSVEAGGLRGGSDAASSRDARASIDAGGDVVGPADAGVVPVSVDGGGSDAGFGSDAGTEMTPDAGAGSDAGGPVCTGGASCTCPHEAVCTCVGGGCTFTCEGDCTIEYERRRVRGRVQQSKRRALRRRMSGRRMRSQRVRRQ